MTTEQVQRAAHIVAPPPEELQLLLRLARIGNMRSIQSHAERLATLDPRHRPLATRLCKLAEDFESAAIVELLATLQEAAPPEGADALSRQPAAPI
jgi:DNA-binding SARP family transcriptional activator